MRSRAEVPPDSQTAHRVAAEVAKQPGREVHEIAAVMGWTVRHCSKALTGAKKGGLIGISRFGNRAKWYPLGDVESVRQAEKDASLERARMQDKARKDRHRIAKLERIAAASGPDLSDEPIRRWVAPSSPLPFVCDAANSVFSWRPAA